MASNVAMVTDWATLGVEKQYFHIKPGAIYFMTSPFSDVHIGAKALLSHFVGYKDFAQIDGRGRVTLSLTSYNIQVRGYIHTFLLPPF